MGLTGLVRRARDGDVDAFVELVRRFQRMAFGYALSLLGDFHHAEDVVQEAFVAAYTRLSSLEEPAAFPGWLRAIVRHCAHRRLRRRHLEALPLEGTADLAADVPGPDRHAEEREAIATALAAIRALPAPLREVASLYYAHDCSQRAIAIFLGLPLTTVNDRLHAARARLKRGMLAMVRNTVRNQGPGDEFAARVGRIVGVEGAVVDVRFDPEDLPEVLTALTVSDETSRRPVTVQVAQRREGGVVRCVVRSPGTPGPGMPVRRTERLGGGPIEGAAWAQAVRRLGASAFETSARPALLETGVKVIDVMCPYVAGGTVAIVGALRAGTLVLVEELVRRLVAKAGGLSLFTFVPPGQAATVREDQAREGFSEGTAGAVQTFYFLDEDAPTADRASRGVDFDAVTCLSVGVARAGIYPAIDPLASGSRALDPAVAGPEHCEVAERVRETLRRGAMLAPGADEALPPEDRLVVARAGKLRRFFAQPFFVAEPYTRVPGRSVSREESLRACRGILDGEFDDWPESAFSFVGGIDDVRARRGTT